MAPEMMTENVQIGPSVDIYSFVVMRFGQENVRSSVTVGTFQCRERSEENSL